MVSGQQPKNEYRESFGQKLFGAVFMMVLVGVIGLIVSMIVALIGDIFTAIAYGKWAYWGGGIGAVIGLIIFFLLELDQAKRKRSGLIRS